jgi:hypothetical protein
MRNFSGVRAEEAFNAYACADDGMGEDPMLDHPHPAFQPIIVYVRT